MVEKMRPKIMVLAIGPHTADSPPKASAVGVRPAIVVIEVRRMGLSRVPAASMTASCTGLPFFLKSLMKLMSTIESLTAMPARATPAYSTVVEMCVP